MQEEPREDDGAPALGAAVPKEHRALFNTHVGAEVALWRKVLGMGQEEFAARVGVERSRLSKIENGKLSPRLDELLGVAALIGADFVDFVQPAYLRYHGQIRAQGAPGRPVA